jgi:hypothetical protein
MNMKKQQEQVQEQVKEQTLRWNPDKHENNENNAYSLFLYGIRSPVTRDYYLRRLRIFFNYIKILPDKTMEERCDFFAIHARDDPNWLFNNIIKFLQFQRERVERKEIVGATLKNFVKPLKLFCEMSDIPIPWKKITRGLPKVKRYADDRAPTIEEIKKICEYPDRRMKAIIYTMSSSGIRLGAWDYLQWRHIIPIKKNGNIIAAKIIVYAGDHEEYFSFITPEAYYELEKWINFRRESGKVIDENTWLMIQLWNTKNKNRYNNKKIKSIGIKQLLMRSLRTQGIRKKRKESDTGYGTRYEFQTNHGFRKWFKTRCELAGMKSINIEKLMGHSVGISDSYYRATESELLEDYLKAIDLLTINEENRLRKKVKILEVEKSRLDQLELSLKRLKEKYQK